MPTTGLEVQAGLLLAIRLCLAAFFLPAALGKLGDHSSFVRGVVEYRILPGRAARAVGILLPPVEFAIAGAMLLGVLLPLAGMLTALLLICFIAAVGVNLRRGRAIPCNCYGIAGTRTISRGTTARNGVLLLMAAAITGLSLSVLTADQRVLSWPLDRIVLRSFSLAAPVFLLFAFGVALVYLVEWGFDIDARISSLLTQGVTRAASARPDLGPVAAARWMAIGDGTPADAPRTTRGF